MALDGAAVIAPTQHADRASWLAARGIGGSDIAKITGISPHGTAFDVWTRLQGVGSSNDNSAMARGRRWERAVLFQYQEETGLKVQPYEHALWRHPRHSWATASLDATVVGESGAVEAKTDMSDARKLWGESREVDRWTAECATFTRAEYATQAYWNAWVSGADYCDLVVLTPFYELRRFRLHADPEVFAALEEQIGAWHQRHVVEGDPPALDRSDACVDWLRHRFPGGEGPRVATEEEAAMVRRYAALKAAIREAEKEAGDLKSQLLAAAGNADVVALAEPRSKRDGSPDLKGVPRLTIIRSEREGGLDVPRLLAEHPEIDAERYRKPPSVSLSLRPYNLE